MAVAIIFGTPRGGGSAKYAIFYALAEETAQKEEKKYGSRLTPEQIASVHELFAEANTRADLGAGVIWSPQCRDGKRPSSIYAEGVNALSTSPEDIELIVGGNPKVKAPVAHYGISVDAKFSETVSDKTLIEFARWVLNRAGWEGHSKVLIVHREKTHAHVHCVMSSVSSVTMRAYRKQNAINRLHESLRYGELEFGFPSDNGPYVIRDRGLPTERVERANAEERHASKQADIDQRLSRAAGKFISDEEGLESVADRGDRIRFNIEKYLAEVTARGETPLRADIHDLAANLTTKIEKASAAGLTFRVMERAPNGHVLETYEDDFGEMRTRYATWLPTAQTIHIPIAEAVPSPLDIRTSRSPFKQLTHQQALANRAWLAALGDVEQAEEEVRKVVTEDPGRISRDLTQRQAVITPVDIDSWVAARVTDGWEDLSNYAIREDRSLVILSAVSEIPIYTTKAQQALELSNYQATARLAQLEHPTWNPDALAQAIAEVEAVKSQKIGQPFKLTDEQKAALANLRYRFSAIQGVSGSGKSTVMAVARRYCELVGRPIAGFATAQSAAERLGDASGIASVNPARALALETHRGEHMVEQDALLIVDEASMFSHRAASQILARAEAKNASVVAIGDVAQLLSLEAGDTWRVLIQAAIRHNTFSQLLLPFRQKDGPAVRWLLKAVPKATEAIKTQDQVAFRDYLLELIENGHVRFHENRKAEVQSIAERIVAATREGRGFIAEAAARTDSRNINRAVLKELGLNKGGAKFKFDRGARYLSPGTKIVFERNAELELGVLNGYVATVTSVKAGKEPSITARLADGKEVTFDPRVYRWVDWGWAVSHYKAQGLEEDLAIVCITRSDDAHSAHMAFTRCLMGLSVDTRLSPEEFVEHLSSKQSLRPKDDALFFKEIVDRTGGAGTPWALSVQRALANDKDPLHQRYYREAQRIQTERGEAVQALLRRNQPLRAATPPSKIHAFDMAQKREMMLINQQYRILPFAMWAYQERESVEREWALEQARKAQVERFEQAETQRQEEASRKEASRRPPTPEQVERLATALRGCAPIAGTAGEDYLRARGLGLKDLTSDVLYAANWYEGCVTTDGRKVSRGLGPAVVGVGRDAAGTVVAASGRLIDPRPGQPAHFTVGEISKAVFMTPGAYSSDVIAITEGWIDALSLAKFEIPAAAPFGTSNRPEWLRTHTVSRETVLATDDDKAKLLGQTRDAVGGGKAAKELNAWLCGDSTVTRMTFGGEKDPNALLQRNPAALKKLVAAAKAEVHNSVQRAYRQDWLEHYGEEPPCGLERSLTYSKATAEARARAIGVVKVQKRAAEQGQEQLRPRRGHRR